MIKLRVSLTLSPIFADVLNHFGTNPFSCTYRDISRSSGNSLSRGKSDLLQTRIAGTRRFSGRVHFSSRSHFHL